MDAKAEAELPSASRGTLVGRYVILDEIARGAMGVVHRAFDPELDRKIALKLVVATSTDRAADLIREARALAKLAHPNVAVIHDVGPFERGLFVAMELVDGGDLERWLERPRSPSEIVRCFIAAGRGLAAAHERGLVHRDFKPRNILVSSDGRVRVADFGLARPYDGVDILEPGHEMRGLVATATTAVAGTPGFMAPEVVAGEPPTPRADQYSFCVSLFWALTGTMPTDTTPPAHRIPSKVEAVVSRGLAVDPKARFSSMNDLLEQLEAAISRGRPRRIGAVVLGLGGGLGIAAAVAAFSPDADSCRAPSPIEQSWGAATRARMLERLSRDLPEGLTPDPERLVRHLDDFAARWSSERAAACAGEPRPDAMVCLDERLRSFRALVHVLFEGPVDFERALAAATRLPEPSTCATSDWRPLRAPTPPNAVIEGSVATARDELARARARDDAGQFAIAEREAESIVAAAEQVNYTPLKAEALLVVASARFGSGDLEGAVETYRAAFSTALASDHDEVALKASTALTTLTAYQQGRLDQAEIWRDIGAATVERLGWSSPLEAEYWAAVGTFHHEAGRLDEARASHARALELRRSLLPDEHPAIADSQYNLANAEFESGNYDAAERRATDAWSRRLSIYGPHHSEVALARSTLGALALRQGALEKALDHLEAAYEVGLATLGSNHPQLAFIATNLANAYNQRSQPQKALELHRAALDIWTRVRDVEDHRLALAHHNIAATHLRLGQAARALPLAQEALRLWIAEFGPNHPKVASGYRGLATIELALGHCDAAIEAADQAIALLRAAPESQSALFPYALQTGGKAYVCGERWKEARKLSQEAFDLIAREVEPSNPVFLGFALPLAEALLELGSREDARALLEMAPAEPSSSDAEHQWVRAQLLLARVEYASGERGRAARRASNAAKHLPPTPSFDGLRTKIETLVRAQSEASD